jgi:predicted DCC family thiol-disulfide oxidoreductase YuxK
MIKLENHHYLLFDGDCGICTSFSEMARKMDQQNEFVIEPYQTYSEAELGKWGITYEACNRKIQVISQAGRVYSGAFALNYFLYRHFPWSLVLIPLYLIPILLLFEIAAYALVARNRQRISRWLGLKGCLIREKPAASKTTENFKS